MNTARHMHLQGPPKRKKNRWECAAKKLISCMFPLFFVLSHRVGFLLAYILGRALFNSGLKTKIGQKRGT